jgi:hypothetical protein
MPKLLPVEVVRLGGNALSFKMCRRTTAGTLKNKLFEDLSMSPECLTLLYNSQPLDDAAVLSQLSKCGPGVSLTCVTSCERVYSCLQNPSTSLHKKRNALQALPDVARSDYQRAINAHVACLREESEDRLTLEIAVEGFVRMAQEGGEAVEALVLDTACAGMQDEKNEAVRACSVEVLGRVGSTGDAVIETKLLQLATDKSYEVRAAVVTALGRQLPSSGGPAAAAIIEFASDESPCVREAAAAALGKMMVSAGNIATLTTLQVLAADPYRFVRVVAASYLASATV